MNTIAKRIFAGEAQDTLSQIFRYGFVAVAAFSVDFAVLILSTEALGIHYLISTAIGFSFGVVVNYLLSAKWVFTLRRIENRITEFSIVAIIGIAGLALLELIMFLSTEYAGAHYLVSKLFATLIVFFWNFTVRKRLLHS